MNRQVLREHTLFGDNRQGDRLAFAPQGDEFAVITEESRLQLWQDSSHPYVYYEMASKGEGVVSVHYNANGTALLLVRQDGSVALYDRESQRVWDVYNGHRATVIQALWRPGKQHWYIASASSDGDILVWNTLHHGCLFRQHVASVQAIAWSPDGVYLAALCPRRLTYWNVETRDELSLDAPSQVADIAWSPDGARLCIACIGACMSIDLQTGVWTHYRQDVNVAARRLAYAPDGVYLAAISYQSLCVWDVETTERMANVLLSFTARTIVWSSGRRLVFDDGKGAVYAFPLAKIAVDSHMVRPFALVDRGRAGERDTSR